MLTALSLRINNLVLKLFGLCYVSGIVSLSLYLTPCLDTSDAEAEAEAEALEADLFPVEAEAVKLNCFRFLD